MEKVAIFRVGRFWLCPNIRVRLAFDKNFYLWLTVGKTHAFAVFTEKYLRLYGCSGTSFTAAVNCTNPNTEIKSENIEIEMIKAQI